MSGYDFADTPAADFPEHLTPTTAWEPPVAPKAPAPHVGTYAARWADATPDPIPFHPFPAPVSRPQEPEAGTVIGFTKQFTEGGPSYSFAALRVGRLRKGWFLTGPNYAGTPMDWDDLLDFIGGPEEWARVGVVESWTPLAGS